ncbi:hypothetical protein B9Z55_021105 [Caenorhabditis nigoni]|uniref:F-box domain-containing protein n=1 Tax=Caenorhabditis nigoni TaxID=1611254 RepID=A0A2G5TR34_9PELO|nr:hypothetical protein B9Z55_021105 [Caenorhabditis nigoni]
MPPPGLASLILYDFSEWKTAHKSYENFGNICVLTKIPAISLEEFETKFHEILKDKYHRKLNFRNLSKINNLKLCILSDVLAGKSLEKSYKAMAEAFGSENIDFLDMDFWFYRFYHRNYDLSYNRSLDAKPLEFLNLPMIIHHKIIDNLDLKRQLSLRRVSKSLKNIVDQGKPAIKNMTIGFSETDIIIACDDLFARYSEDLGVDYRKIALNYVMILLKNPKLRLDLLHIVSFCSPDPVFIDFLKNLKHKISTKVLELDVNYAESTNIFLACLKPKYLVMLVLYNGNIDEIVNMDQWKFLKHALCHSTFSGPIDCFLGFSLFSIILPELTEEHLMTLKEGFSKSEIINCCCIHPRQGIPLELIERVFCLNYGPEYMDEEKIQYSHTVPNSGNTLIIIIHWDCQLIQIKRSS